MDTLTIRPMALSDCDRVAEIRVTGWRHAYRGLMPQADLDGLSAEADAERRRAHFTRPDDPTTHLVAERAGQVVGWASVGPYRDGETRTPDAELYALYADPAHIGTGIGRTLLTEALARSTAHPRILLWVLRDNTRARSFYERAGFRPDGAEDGTSVPEVRYARSQLRCC
ncbi:GNAT family N-acetyltransferase [Streptomyces bauhiniae]|uniref:GNAT family N-acetyltransferase n=1 Tax=Streptomyces bauhiniae TaxID=2340725 RepID=A0A4Z1D3S7_9ACTN|nr:GNAT family N-acetyltransferase [Streptomyces bauhiniae]TGN76442.1 GNAT family N-acetyltransferase [Streptomyces bauhiniae]